MMTQRSEEAIKLKNEAAISDTTDSKARLEQMESRFRRLESVKGLDARIAEVEVWKILILLYNVGIW